MLTKGEQEMLATISGEQALIKVQRFGDFMQDMA